MVAFSNGRIADPDDPVGLGGDHIVFLDTVVERQDIEHLDDPEFNVGQVHTPRTTSCVVSDFSHEEIYSITPPFSAVSLDSNPKGQKTSKRRSSKQNRAQPKQVSRKPKRVHQLAGVVWRRPVLHSLAH